MIRAENHENQITFFLIVIVFKVVNVGLVALNDFPLKRKLFMLMSMVSMIASLVSSMLAKADWQLVIMGLILAEF